MSIKRNIIVLASIVGTVCIALALGWAALEKFYVSSAHTKGAYNADNLNALTKDSTCILLGHVLNDQTNITYGGVDFVTTKIQVNKVFKGMNSSNGEITLLQTKCAADPIVEKNTDTLLFLEKYEGPIVKDAYVCKGLSQGQYRISGNSILPSKKGMNSLLENEICGDNISDFESKLSNLIKADDSKP